MTEVVSIETKDGSFGGYRALASEPGPVGILLLPEMFGLTPAMCNSADTFAQLGCTTIVPNLFWRYASHPGVLGYEGDDRQIAFERLQALDADAAVEDIDAAAAVLLKDERIRTCVAVGHCIGGRLAVLALPDTRIAGAVSYYGLGISKQGDALRSIGKPAQLHYGMADEHVPMAEVQAVAALVAPNPAFVIFGYPDAGHSFCNPYRPMYDETAAMLVRLRTMDFIRNIAV